MVGVQQLSFSYGKQEVLKKIQIEVDKGQFVSVIGPNGSGKTTLLKNICKLLTPNSGQINLENERIKKMGIKNLAKKMAVVHQGAHSAFDFNVGEVVLMGRYPHLAKFQSESAADMAIAENAMRQTETIHLKDKTLYSISGGERQRVMIARALAQEPQLLLLDEPISHLDIKHQIEIMKLCRQLNHDKGLTVLATLHDINLASRFSDYVVMMKKGEVYRMGKPLDVINPENIKAVYDIDVVVVNHTYPMIVPL